MKTGREVVNSREDKYNGIPFSKRASLAQRLKSDARYFAEYTDIDWPSHFEAIDMIFHKIARILAGNPNDVDSWLDIAGYAELMVDEIEKSSRR